MTCQQLTFHRRIVGDAVNRAKNVYRQTHVGGKKIINRMFDHIVDRMQKCPIRPDQSRVPVKFVINARMSLGTKRRCISITIIRQGYSEDGYARVATRRLRNRVTTH